ncbi:unnamed protein product [Sphagnum balticum]
MVFLAPPASCAAPQDVSPTRQHASAYLARTDISSSTTNASLAKTSIATSAKLVFKHASNVLPLMAASPPLA